MRNSSGFHGYPIASVYPDMGDLMSQTAATIVDPDEAAALSAQEPEKKVAPAVHSGTRKETWLVLAAIVGIVLVFGMPTIKAG